MTNMLIVGLTGSMAMGKSTAARYLQSRGIPVFDSDAAVHRLYEEAETVALVESAFPGTTSGGKVDRARLACAVAGSCEALSKLEKIVHPLVRQSEWTFLKRQNELGAELAVLDVPLLFEVGRDKVVDVIIVVSAPESIQRQRLAERAGGMTEQQMDALLARQMPDADKRARADFVVDTSGSFEDTYRQIDSIVETLKKRTGSAFEMWLRQLEPGAQDS